MLYSSLRPADRALRKPKRARRTVAGLRACVESLGKIVVKVSRFFKSNRLAEEISRRR